MLLEMVKQFNWVDTFVVIVLFRICYIAVKNGLAAEIFKLLGTLAAIYLSLHYYTALSDWVKSRLSLEKLSLEFLDFISLVILVFVGYAIFILLREVFARFIKMEAVPKLDKWGGFVLGGARGVLLTGLIIFMLVASSISYLKTSVDSSYLGRRILRVGPATYGWLLNSITSKFVSSERYNETVNEVESFKAPVRGKETNKKQDASKLLE
jgi:uncharacterized membrane protein required for colicin V production